MKVKISYSVDIDDIPDSVIKILQEAHAGIDEVSNKFRDVISKAGSTREYLKILDDLDGIRKVMYQVDQQLEDCYDIVGGYQRVRIQQHTQEHQALETASQQQERQPAPTPKETKSKGKK